MATLTFYPNADGDAGATTTDGFVAKTLTSGWVWATGHDATAGTSVDYTSTAQRIAWISTHASTDTYYTRFYRGIFGFDTSSISSGATITSATLSLRGSNKTVTNFTSSEAGWDLVINNCTAPDSATVLASADYNNLGTTVLGSVTYANWSTTAYNDITLSTSSVTKAGITWLGTRFRYDSTNTPPTFVLGANIEIQARYADYADTTSDPKLVVVYTATSIKTINDLAIASVKTVNDLAIASMKTWGDLA